MQQQGVRTFCCGKAVDQLQMYLKGGAGLSAGSSSSSKSSPEHSDGLLAMNSEETNRIVTVSIDHERNGLAPVGVAPIYDTGCPFSAFGIVKLAVTNTRADMSPYGQSVVADAVDVVQAIPAPFSRQDCTVFRKVMSTEDTIHEFAPALRTSLQSKAFRIALQMLGDLTGFGIGYFDFDELHG